MTDCEARWRELDSRLAASPFRSRFKLDDRDREYIAAKGWRVIRAQTEKIVRERLSAANPLNDGKQTPMRGHVVFKAQHGCGCCCRNCLAKWHGIPPGRPLDDAEIDYVTKIILLWLRDRAGTLPEIATTPDLF